MTRNWAFISPEEQEKIRSTRVLLAGCGLGSAVAVLAVDTGFTQFVVVDHDRVELSNLNRQAYRRSHIGTNKALALKEILEERSEVVSVRALDEAVTCDNAAELVSLADIVVNTVDFDDVTYALNEAARLAGKAVIFPMNIGWGGFSLVFTPGSATLDDMLGPERPDSDAEFIARLLASTEDFALPGYLASRIRELPEIVSTSGSPAPQLGVACARSAGLVVEAMVRMAIGLPVRVAPRPVSLDAWDVWAG